MSIFNLCTGLQNRSILSSEKGLWIVFEGEHVVKLNLETFARAKKQILGCISQLPDIFDVGDFIAKAMSLALAQKAAGVSCQVYLAGVCHLF